MIEPAARILLVDDDAALAGLLQEFLELQGFEVALAHQAEDALSRIAETPPDLVVLDVMLPGISGFEALRRLRERHDVPVIMLTARGEESERILGLMGGADDYLSKPCSPLELAVRIRTVLKRARRTTQVSATSQESMVSVGPLTVDLRRCEARVRGARIGLTPAELRVLEQLLRHPGEVLSRSQLTQLALDRPIEAYDRSIDTIVSKLRRKLEAAGLPTKSIGGLRGHGYVLDPSALESL